jgi:hypothetical protein
MTCTGLIQGASERAEAERGWQLTKMARAAQIEKPELLARSS